jgi:uncharacterized small protein (DUF1192 family)
MQEYLRLDNEEFKDNELDAYIEMLQDNINRGKDVQGKKQASLSILL